MTHEFARITARGSTPVLGLLVFSTLFGCASAAPEGEPERSRTLGESLTCGSTVSGTYATIGNYYTYPAQSLQIDCAAPGAPVSVFVSANDVPNRFTILDGNDNPVVASQWLGNATYSGRWGSTLSNSGTASLSFSNSNGPYSIRVETLTPPDGSYPQTTDVWSASPSCQCLRHYTCGYAMSGNNCDNGRTHVNISAANMTDAIAACRATRPAGNPGYPDFCHVLAADGAINSDVSQCTSANASWRAGNSCCNFMGTKSCPF